MSLPIANEYMPAVLKIVEQSEAQLLQLTGIPVKVTLDVKAKELTETILQTIVCNFYQVTWSQVRSGIRKPVFVITRKAYSYLCWKYLGKEDGDTANDMDYDRTSVIRNRKEFYKKLESKDFKSWQLIHLVNNKLNVDEPKTV